MSLPPELAAAVADALGRPVGSATRLGGGDINEAWQVATSEWPVFVTAHRTAGLAAFEDEAWGLRWLAEPGSVAVPEVLGVGQVGDGPWAFLALAWVEPGRPSDHHDERLGRGLAELHAAGAPSFGLDRPGTLGSLRLDNTPGPTWPEFFRTRRLEPLIRAAVDAGAIDPSARALADRVGDRLVELAGPPEPPARLHGDLWAGNALVGADGLAVLIDPSAHGGHREVDLAMMDLFGGFGPGVWRAYDERWPLADGWRDRLALWQLQPLLVHAVLFGGGYGASALARLRHVS